MDKQHFLCFALVFFSVVANGYWINDLEHPCVRECKADSEPMICEYDWTVESYFSMSRACYQCPFEQYDCHRPHCVPMAGYARPIYTINRKLPGPSIQVCKNDVIKVHVHNRLQNEEGEAIHWHGFHMRGSQHMDGVPKVTQCAINAGHDFTYEFGASQAGTHWWHSHSGTHRADGAFGSFIIRQSPEADPNRELYDTDDPRHVILINEWGKATMSTVDAAGQHGVTLTPNDGILINGRGTNQVLSRADNTTATVDHHVVYVRSGRRYRFRVIGSAANICPLTISIDDHPLTVIAMDGAPVNPIEVDRITIFSGERYDFVLSADQPTANYWIRVAGELACTRHQEVGILRYAGRPPGSKPTADKSVRSEGRILNHINGLRNPGSVMVADLSDADEKEYNLEHADVTHYLELNAVIRNKAMSLHHPIFYPYERAGDDTFTATPLHVINNITLALPATPLLSHWRQMERASFCNDESLRTSDQDCIYEACECIHRIDIKYDQVVEVVFVNTLAGLPHPMHLHGYYFDIVGMDTMWNFFTIEDFKRLDAKGEIHRNLINSPRKDTIMIPAGGYVIARFKADNPGWWLMHCHFDGHFKLGMGMIFHVEGDIPEPPNNMPVCADK